MSDTLSPDSSTATLLSYLRQLVALTGPSGAEEDVVRALLRLATRLADSVEVDAFGNVIAIRRAASENPRRLLLAAHTDEVGFWVRQITPQGFLRLEKVGGTDDRILPAQRVWVPHGSGAALGRHRHQERSPAQRRGSSAGGALS